MPITGIYASQISGHLWQPQGAYDALASVTLSASTASVTFAGIPTGYTHLQIRTLSRGTDSGNSGIGVRFRFNGDTGSNYALHGVDGYQGESGGVEALSGIYQTFGLNYFQPSAGNNATVYAGGIIDILDYSNTNKYKTVRSLGGYDINGSTSGYNYIGLYSSLWQSTSAITSVTLFSSSNNFDQYSSFALYGVK